MSALTDTMARIKGALDGMHTKPPEPPKKWLPPALREKTDPAAPVIPDAKPEPQPQPEVQHEPPPEPVIPAAREVFDTTGIEPPRSPKPAWNHFAVHLPRQPRAIEPVSQKRLRHFYNQFFLTRVYPPANGQPAVFDGILYNWIVGSYANSCDPFLLNFGTAYPGSDASCSVTISG